MPIALTAYTAEGLLTGWATGEGRLMDLVAMTTSVILDTAVLSPFDGPPQRVEGRAMVDVDDLMAIVAMPDTATVFHSVWHPITIDFSPYRLSGELPALPGFDPARALARPTGSFVLVGRATVELRSAHPTDKASEHDFVWVNRYAVDAVESDLDLGFFFPGAHERVVQPATA